MRVAWALALLGCDGPSGTRRGTLVTTGQAACAARTKERFVSRAGCRGTARDFIALLRTACNLQLMNCYFWNIPFNISTCWFATGSKPWTVKLQVKGTPIRLQWREDMKTAPGETLLLMFLKGSRCQTFPRVWTRTIFFFFALREI